MSDTDSLRGDGASVVGTVSSVNDDTHSLLSNATNPTVEAAGAPTDAGSEKSVPSDESAPSVVEQKVSRRRPGKATEIPLYERRNWLLHLHYVRKEYAICKALIQEILLESAGVCEYAMYVKALILREEGAIQESLDSFQQCVVINPTNPLNLKQVARSLFLLGRHKASLQVYQEALKVCPHDWEIFHNQGVCLMYTKEFEKAKEHLNAALQLSKHDITYKMLGKCCLLEHNIEEAVNTFKKAVDFSPENPELMTTLGLLYMQLNMNQKAFEMLGNALVYDPGNVKSILAAGAMIQDQGDFDVALTKYHRASTKIPESPQLWNNIGMCFFGKGKYVASISCLKRAIYLAPFEWTIMYNLGLVHITMQQYASAFHYLTAAITMKPRLAKLYMLLAIVLTHLDSHDNARQAYEQALKYNTTDPQISLNFAVFLCNIERHGEAAEQLMHYKKKVEAGDGEGKKLKLDEETRDVLEQLEAKLQAGVVYS